MKKSLISMIALMFMFAFGAAQANQHMKEEGKKKDDPIAAACKGKKAGDKVTVDGKEVKCPAPKKEMKKKTTEPAPAAPAK